MFCPKCGNPMDDGVKFCGKCGFALDDGNGQNVSNPVPTYSDGSRYKLTLNRPKTFVACLVAFTIFIDNEKVGKIKNGQTIELDVTGGSHTISINKNNPTTIVIDGNTSADVVVFGANNFGITNVSGQANNNISTPTVNYLEKNRKAVDWTLYATIGLSVLSIILFITSKVVISAWVYGIIIGYVIVNIVGLKNLNNSNPNDYKSLLTKSIITIVIAVIVLFVTNFLLV